MPASLWKEISQEVGEILGRENENLQEGMQSGPPRHDHTQGFCYLSLIECSFSVDPGIPKIATSVSNRPFF